ncbi:hypothetical protein PFISCL1PPCAC_1772, partial [Pristionchus fissidentatus]
STPDPFALWYSQPLEMEDILAGGSLILLTLIFIPLYLLVIAVFIGAEKDIIGFRYLISMAIADILCMIQYALINGIAILTKSRLVSVSGRPWLQFYIDYTWSRLLAILSPHSFRLQSRRASYTLSFVVGWLAPLILECATHFQPFITTFYFEPALYGITSDNFEKYLTDGHSLLFLIVNTISGLLPFLFYGIAIIILIKHRITLGGSSNRLMNVERKLILPCSLTSVVFIVGQVAIMQGTGNGKWASWSICFLFFINSALQPVLLIAFSEFVR